MTAHLVYIPPKERRTVTVNWARKRATLSERPFTFMNTFEDAFKTVMTKGEDALLYERSGYKDPLQVAAEVEALAAVRALRTWGTNDGLYVWETKNRLKKHRYAS